MKKIIKAIYNLRFLKNLRNYIRTKRLTSSSDGQISLQTIEGKAIYEFINENDFKTILEIGTWNGLGSTKTVIEAIKNKSYEVNFLSLETDKIAYKYAKKNLKESSEFVDIIYGRIIEVDELPSLNTIDFEYFGFDKKNSEWYIQDLRRYSKTKNVFSDLPEFIDFIIFDGGEFSTFVEFIKLWKRTKFFALDDIKTYKQYEVLKFINENEENFKLIKELENFSIYEVLGDS